MDTASRLTLLVLALGLALQPWSVIASVLLVASRNGTRRAAAFVLGWFLALAAVAAATALLATPGQPSSSTSTLLSAVDLALGVVLAGWLLVRLRRARRAPGVPAPVETPRWMARIDTMPAWLAFLLGGFLPSYVLVVAAVSQLLQAGFTGPALWLHAAVFVVIASFGVAAPLAVVVVRRERAPEIHASWRAWLIGNSSAITGWIIGVVAVLLLVKGLVGLLT